MTVLFNMPWQQAFDGSGNTLAGAKLYFYQAGTSTPANVYSDVGLGVPLSNPVIANGAGRFPPIYLEDNSAYKVRYCSSEDVEIWTADNVVTTSTESDVTVVLQAITQTSISAGYTEEEAQNPTNFVRAVYKYASASYWFTDEGSTTNSYILEGVDDYTRPIDYFTGMQVWFYTTRANTGAATVNVASLGTKNIIRSDGETLEAGDIDGLVHMVYNGAAFVVDEEKVTQSGNQTIYGEKTFDESPVLPTPTTGDNSTKGATTAFVKDAIINWGKPDYANKIATAANTSTYTTLADGWVQIMAHTGNVQTATFSIGSTQVWKSYSAGDRSADTIQTSGLFFVKSGTVCTASYPSSQNDNIIYFYPMV